MRGVCLDDMVANSTDGFSVRTHEEFLAFLRAAAACGGGWPEAPGALLAAYPNLHNPAGNSHQPIPGVNDGSSGSSPPGSAQRFLAAYVPMVSHFRPRRHRLSGTAYYQEIRQRFQAL